MKRIFQISLGSEKMDEELISKMMNTSLSSTPLTHNRLKHFSKIAETSEDNISRIGISLSLAKGEVELDYKPRSLGLIDAPLTVDSSKNIRGKTLFKEDLLLFMALINLNQKVSKYDDIRSIFRSHWERGVQLMTEKSNGESDWINIVNLISK